MLRIDGVPYGTTKLPLWVNGLKNIDSFAIIIIYNSIGGCVYELSVLFKGNALWLFVE